MKRKLLIMPEIVCSEKSCKASICHDSCCFLEMLGAVYSCRLFNVPRLTGEAKIAPGGMYYEPQRCEECKEAEKAAQEGTNVNL